MLKGLRRWLDVLLDDAATIDVHLVLSELVTNAIEHGLGGEIRIDVIYDEDLTIAVANRADRAPEIQEQSMPMPKGRGRGLAIVAATADRLEISFLDGMAAVTCEFTAHRVTSG